MKIPKILLYLTLGFLFVNPQTPTSSNSQFTDYRGVKIGMTTEEVRKQLDGVKKGDDQDSVFFSDKELAQIYYKDGKVTAISVDYFNPTNAPTPETVLGEALQAKADGSMYQLKRYPDKGFWVSYNRTAGEKPITTITVQKL